MPPRAVSVEHAPATYRAGLLLYGLWGLAQAPFGPFSALLGSESAALGEDL